MKRCLRCIATFESPTWQCPNCGALPATRQGLLAFAPEFALQGDDDVAYAYEDLAAAESAHFWFVHRAAMITWILRKCGGDVASFLEMGCGTGGVTTAIRRAFPHARVVAGEIQVRGLLIAHQRLPDVECLQLDSRSIPFHEEFAAAGAFDVIEHIDDDVGAVRALADAVVPGGLVIVTVPQHQWMWSEIDTHSHHRRRYSRKQLRDTLIGAGLRPLWMTSLTTLLLPLMLLSRRKPGEFDPVRELKIPRLVNLACSAVCSVERAIVRTGVSLPVGGSLLAVGRKENSRN